MTQQRAITVRLPDDLHQQLREYVLFCGTSANDLVVGLVRDFLDGPGRQRVADGMTARARERYGPALDALAAND
jgi:hypothetical protein